MKGLLLVYIVLQICIICEGTVSFLPLYDTIQTLSSDDQSTKELLPKNCGNVRPTWRGEGSIIKAELFEFPFYAELIYENAESNSPTFLCGGTLISNRYVVTAASCIKSKPKLIAVRLGDCDLDTNPDCEYGLNDSKFCAPPYVEIDVRSDDVIVYDSSENEKYDLALIKLSKEVKFSDAIEPVCLPIKPNYDKEGNITLIGFPRADNSPSRLNWLRRLAIPYIASSQCQEYLNKSVQEDYFCTTGRKGSKYCQGYGGSPILHVIAEEFRLRWVLGGIVPYDMNICDQEGMVMVLPRMKVYNEWILKNIKG